MYIKTKKYNKRLFALVILLSTICVASAMKKGKAPHNKAGALWGTVYMEMPINSKREKSLIFAGGFGEGVGVGCVVRYSNGLQRAFLSGCSWIQQEVRVAQIASVCRNQFNRDVKKNPIKEATVFFLYPQKNNNGNTPRTLKLLEQISSAFKKKLETENITVEKRPYFVSDVIKNPSRTDMKIILNKNPEQSYFCTSANKKQKLRDKLHLHSKRLLDFMLIEHPILIGCCFTGASIFGTVSGLLCALKMFGYNFL